VPVFFTISQFKFYFSQIYFPNLNLIEFTTVIAVYRKGLK